MEKAKLAKEQSLISQYKEQIEIVKAETKLQYIDSITLEKLKNAYDENGKKQWVYNTEIITDDLIEKIKLTTNDGYIFYITKDTTEYKGKNGVIIQDTTKITITATPDSKKDTAVSNITININVTFTDNITSSVGQYAWKSDLTSVANSEWKTLTLNASGDKERTGEIISTQQASGDYYLWIKVVINGKEEIKKFGEYKFISNPTQSNLICKIVSKSADSTTGTAELGSDMVFDGWTLSYTINGEATTTLTQGTTTTINNITKGDLVVIKYSKENETDVTKTLNVDELKIAYTLKYNASGGTNTPSDQVNYDNSSFTISTTIPELDGKVFDGWYVNSGLTGTKYSANDVISITGTEMTLYAKWININAGMITYNRTWGDKSITDVEQALDYLYTQFGD